MASNVGQYATGKLRGIPKIVIIWYRQNHPNRCFYCGEHLHCNNRSRDHVVPQVQVRANGSSGGRKNNIVPACKTCNQKKGKLQVVQFRNNGDMFWGEGRYIES